MKTFLKTGVLLVSLGAFASSPDPAFYQYWFDTDESLRAKNTHVYDANSNPLIIDANGLSEGGHAVYYRMADKDKKWGSVMTSYFVVPSATPRKDPKEATEPVLIQYWFDNDEASRVKNTRAYNGHLEVEANGLSEGGHALKYRMANKDHQWGSLMMRYFTVPSVPDKSSSKAVAYRVWINNDIVASGSVPSNSDFTLTTEMPDNPALGSVDSREFSYSTGEKTVTLAASGKFTCSFQMLSDNNEWGMPIHSEYDHSVNTKLPTDSVAVPCDYTFKKIDNSSFKAYRFNCGNISTIYLKASQDCSMGLYKVDSSKDSNLALVKTITLKKGETTKLTDSNLSNRQLVAILYDTKKDASNQDDDVFLRIMYEENKLPKPVISFDNSTWEVTLSCADQRAKIYYTLDGNQPTVGNDKRLEYKGPIKLEKFTKVLAIAEYGDLKPSEVADMTISDQNMRLPKPQLEFHGGKELNEFIFTNSVEGVTTYYVLGKGEIADKLLDDAGQRITYDGKPFVIEDGASLKAYSTKNLLADSEILSMTVHHNDYVTQTPKLSGTKTEGEDKGDVSAIKNYVQISVPEGNAKYRIVQGKKSYTYGEEIVADEWKDCGEGWIELPGGALSGDQTVQAYAESDGKVRSAVISHYTDWVKALKPKTEYDNYHLKLSTDMPGGVIRYNIGAYNEATALYYLQEEQPEGIDFTGISTVTAWVQAAGYAASERVTVNKKDYDIASPIIRYEEDGYLHVSHEMEDADIFIMVDPEQEMETILNNHYRFIPEYNTTVEAYATKKGYNNSETTIKAPLPKPEIVVDGFKVKIENIHGTVYYTTDGSKPAKDSKTSYEYKDVFESGVATIRAACFSDGEIPSEADRKEVIGQTASPMFEFNFSRQTVDGVMTDVRKMKISSVTAGASIYYSLNEEPTESTRKLYDPSVDAEGVDVAGADVVYAYAESEGLRRSEVVSLKTSDGYLTPPSIRVNDGVVEIRHSDPSVNIVPVFNPEQEFEYVHDERNNTVTCQVKYNTSVKAHVEKMGYIESDPVIANPIAKPVIKVDAYKVEIEYSDGEVYYTIDGSLPTKKSSKYGDKIFETSACTVRAVAFKEGMIPAEADSVKVMDQVERPEIVDISKEYLVLSSKTPKAVIYYSLNEGITDYNRQVFNIDSMPNGIDIREARTIYTYAEAEGYRRSEPFDFFKNDYVLKEPTIGYSKGYVIAEHDDSDAEIRFTDENGKTLQPDDNNSRRVQVAYNSTVDAYAYKKGFVASEKVRLGHTDIPQISAELFTVTIKKKSAQTVRYTIDGTQPNITSQLYEDPFTVSESCTVRAVAFEGELIPAEAESCPIGYVRCQRPEKDGYDGRYLTLKVDVGSTIRYVLGQSTTDIREGNVYNGKIDMKGLTRIRAIAQRADAADSEVMEFTPEYYADETDAYTSRSGVLKEAFGWSPDKSGFTSLTVHGPLISSSTEDSGDYEFLRSLPNLRHLDLRNVTDSYIPSGALDASSLRSIVLPVQMTGVGSNIFGSSNATLCALEITSDDLVPSTLLSGLENPNLLLYVKNANNASAAVANSNGVVKNIVVTGTGHAENVSLRHGLPFYAHKEFTAENISFTRAFTKETQIGGFGSGWETMVVPFNVQKIESAGRVLMPFGDVNTDKGECPFWLFSANDTEWNAVTSMFANTPYLIAMPNNRFYADEFVINGDVVFSSKVVTVPVTPAEEDMTRSFGVGRSVTGNYNRIGKNEGKLVINESAITYQNQDYLPGGIFISNERDVAPFECYVESSGAKAIPVFDGSEVDELLGDYGTRIWGEGYAICIRSSIAMKLRIYDTVGQLIRIVDVKAGETVRVDDITPGIYFVGTTKVLVKG